MNLSQQLKCEALVLQVTVQPATQQLKQNNQENTKASRNRRMSVVVLLSVCSNGQEILNNELLRTQASAHIRMEADQDNALIKLALGHVKKRLRPHNGESTLFDESLQPPSCHWLWPTPRERSTEFPPGTRAKRKEKHFVSCMS